MFASALAARAQLFTSGSMGADGALVLITPGTIVFEGEVDEERMGDW